MALPQAAQPAHFFVAVLAADGVDLADIAACLEDEWGAIDTRSEILPFHYTNYYEPEMGKNIRRVFYGFQAPLDPAELAARKLRSNEMEAEFAERLAMHLPVCVPRPVNLDPGYLTPANVILASAKPFYHRIYLQGGIYAEITLYYREGSFLSLRWTFPDYGSGDYFPFLLALREKLMASLKRNSGDES